jgi:hypothetical protein
MLKKFFSILLAVVFCLTSVIAFADGKGLVNRENKGEVLTTESQTTDTNDAIEDKDADDAEEQVEDADDAEEQDEDADDADEQVEDADDADEQDEDVDNGKKIGKAIKEQLEAKKQERAAARLEAKDFIKDLHKMFKDADNETKKEILSEIAGIKKELKSFSIGVFVKGLVVDFEKYDNVEPVIEKDRVLVPVRAIVETLGADVLWNGETEAITITKGDISIVLNIGSLIAIVNGEEVTLDVAPKMIKDRTLVPLRFISETLNLGVEWDEDSQTVIVDNEGEDEDTTEEGTTTEDADTEDADAEDADTEDADIEDADIEDADIEDADTEDADTEDSDAEEADTEEADAEEADNEEANAENGAVEE